jgi:sulfate adenylyltransferase
VTDRTHVLDEDGLDLLELALGGAIEPPTLDGGTEVVFTDAENTPVARLQASVDGTRLEPLQPFARHGGPAWDPALRLAPAAAREALGGPAPTVLVDDTPTRADLDRVVEDPRLARETLLLAIPVARRAAPPGHPGASARVRASLAFGEAIRDRRPGLRIVPLVVPWPDAAPHAGGWPPLHSDAVLAAYGASAVVSLVDGRTASEWAAIERLDATDATAVRELYLDASATELLRTRATATGPGAVILFTGLSGSGKSTIARALVEELADGGGRRVTLLDGDEIRRHLSAELGFDAASRERNVERIGWVASLVAGHGGIAVAAPIAPFEASRARVRAMAEAEGATFLLVWISTPLAVCEGRDRKGLYARARAGEVEDFTGISSPYETPADADVVIDTTVTGVDEAVAAIRAALEARLGAGTTAS